MSELEPSRLQARERWLVKPEQCRCDSGPWEQGAVNEISLTHGGRGSERKVQPGQQEQHLAEGTKAALRCEIRPMPRWWPTLLSSL